MLKLNNIETILISVWIHTKQGVAWQDILNYSVFYFIYFIYEKDEE